MGARFSAPVQTGPGAHPASCTMGTRSFPGVKRPGRGVDHPPHIVPRLKIRAIPLLHFSAFMAVVERTLPLPFISYLCRVRRDKFTCSVMNKRKVILTMGFDISSVQPPPFAAPENEAR